MMHPLFTQFNEDLGNRLNAGRPADDFATYGETITKAIAGVVSANGTAEDPRSYGGKLRTGSCPTSCLTRSGHQPCSGLPNGTVARLRTTRPTSCSPSRRTLRFTWGSARSRLLPSRRGVSLTLLPSSERTVRPHESSHASHVPRPTFLWLGGARPSCDTPSRTR
jgi:hypothetical protein